MNYWQSNRPRRRGGIPNLMLYIVIGMGLVFVLNMVFSRVYTGDGMPSLTALLSFDRNAIFAGEVWRAVSFVFLPPSESALWVIFSLYFYWLIGQSLEGEWGTSRFTLYYLIGILGSIVSGLITGYATNVYLNLSLFFAAATLFPNYQLMIFFFIPIKMKWLALLDAVMFAVGLIFGTLSSRMAMLFALLNYFIFFGKPFWNAVSGFFGRHFRKARFTSAKRQGERENQQDVISREDRDYWKNR